MRDHDFRGRIVDQAKVALRSCGERWWFLGFWVFWGWVRQSWRLGMQQGDQLNQVQRGGRVARAEGLEHVVVPFRKARPLQKADQPPLLCISTLGTVITLSPKIGRTPHPQNSEIWNGTRSLLKHRMAVGALHSKSNLFRVPEIQPRIQ